MRPLPAALDLGLAIFDHSGDIARSVDAITEAGRRDAGRKNAGERVERFFGKIQAPFALQVILKIAVQAPVFPTISGVVGKVQGRQALVRSDGG